MELETFADPVRLGGTVRYVLWQSAFEFEVPEQLVRDSAGRIRAFSSVQAAQSHAAAHGLALSEHLPGIDPTRDLDAVLSWVAQPSAATLDHGLISRTWMFLNDAGVLPGMYDEGLDASVQQVVWQLDAAELAAIDPRSAHLAPRWSDEELAVLARTLRRGIEEFAALLSA